MTVDQEWFWSRVSKTDTCWIWTGWVSPYGYGRLRFEGRNQLAHRVSYILTHGPIPDGLTIDHLCYVKTCVNPAHLEAVTAAVNYARAVAHGRVSTNGDNNRRKTHCPRNHPYDEKNTHVDKRGSRICRACRRDRAEISRRRRQEPQ
jgi:hypothetical protein